MFRLSRVPRGGGSPFFLILKATFIDARVKWARDRSLDLAVEKERHIRPLHAVKDLLLVRRPLASSDDSIPLSVIAERRDELDLPFPALRFISIYPSAFLLFDDPPSSSRRVRATAELAQIHQEELDAHRSTVAELSDRLTRLLMLTRRGRIPLAILDRLRWDLALPRDYPRSLLVQYPDRFELVPGADDPTSIDLGLVSWNPSLAVSTLEQVSVGKEVNFPQSFPPGFALTKKVQQWTDELQGLPYMSPYEDGTVLHPRLPVVEKWVIGVLHEILHLMASKKARKNDLVAFGELVGLPKGFEKAFLRYPGIFYISNKLRTQTIVLREAYRSDLLREKHPVVGVRFQYMKLMCQGRRRR